jgi:hypothetical protein
MDKRSIILKKKKLAFNSQHNKRTKERNVKRTLYLLPEISNG